MASISTSTCNVAVACSVIFLLDSAFYPASSIQNVVISDSQSDLRDSKIGYYSQAIVYISSILGSLACSLLYDVIGLKATYGLGVGLYCVMYTAVIVLKSWALYTAAVLTGLGVGIHWVMAPRIVADNSTKQDLMRNFSFLNFGDMLAIVIGSMWDYFYIEHLTNISDSQRATIYSVCICITALATAIAVGFTKYPGEAQVAANKAEQHREVVLSCRQLMVTMVTRPEFYCCVIQTVYCGMVTSYIWLTFTTCIGATFPMRGTIALAGIVIGASGALGSLLWERVAVLNLTAQTLILALVASSAYILSFLTFPGDAPYNPSPVKESYITPSVTTILLISGLLGASNSGFCISANLATGKVFRGYEGIGYMMENVIWCGTTGVMFAIGPLMDIQTFLVLVQIMMALTVAGKLWKLNKP